MAEQESGSMSNHVVAVINGSAAAEAASRDLHQKGFTQTTLFRANEVAEKVDPKGENSGLLGKFIKAVQDHLTEETNYLTQYQEEARNGNDVVAVLVEDREQADQVKTILESHGARNLRFFGKLAVTDMTPETNPTARSQDSPERLSDV